MRQQKTSLLKGAPTPLEGISAVVHGIIEIANDDRDCPAGCMAINALVELAPHDAKVQEILAAHTNAMRSSLEETVAAARRIGRSAAWHRPPAVAEAPLFEVKQNHGSIGTCCDPAAVQRHCHQAEPKSSREAGLPDPGHVLP